MEQHFLYPQRRQNYDKIKGNIKQVIILKEGKLNTNRTGDWGPFDPIIFSTQMEEGETISVISDGINSFRKANNDPIPWNELVDEFTGFKTLEGEFALRRIAAFKRKCLKEGITHSDDISIASIIA